jgi:signal transduction histidine kinase
LQRAQRRSQRLESLGTLASGIAHDLNNLLTPILMSSRMLQQGGENLDREAMLDMIVAAASRGAELISQLLTFARGGEAQHHPVNVGMLLTELSSILQRALTDDIKLDVKSEPGLPNVVGDETELSQVIMNLAINARDAMPDGGELCIAATRLSLDTERSYSMSTLQPGSYVAISVHDTGSGIPANIRDRIFDPFFSTKDRGQGTGLGLSTSVGIVRSHDGAIDVESTVGKGTTVTVIFPTADDEHKRGLDE